MGKPRALLPACIPECGGVWADLGCGEGIFTQVLHALLGPESVVFALDRDPLRLYELLRNARRCVPGGRLLAVCGDFRDPLPFGGLDGVLIANALHFVPGRDKRAVLASILDSLQPGGRLVVVEYNTTRATGAVPHPISSEELLRLAGTLPLRAPRVAARTPSSYLGEIFAAVGIKD
jgi:SAM-dependent methyltransferase